jgi:hypothetical protein
VDTHKWSKLKMYPVAVTLLPLRIVMFVFMLFMPYLSLKVFYFGLDLNKPIVGLRAVLAKKFYGFFSGCNVLSLGIVVRRKDIAYDYTKWLGPNYKTIAEE